MAFAHNNHVMSSEEREANRIRFEQELEFVQSLANPFYVSNLAFQGVLEDEAFVNYLDYLQYWATPAYAKFLHYPQATQILSLLRKKAFRDAFKNEGFAAEVSAKLVAQWANHSPPSLLKVEDNSPAPNSKRYLASEMKRTKSTLCSLSFSDLANQFDEVIDPKIQSKDRT